MNSYKFTLKRHKAIADANIELNGITVLAGENGAGKSTITRWLYYLVEVIAKYEKFLYDDLRRDISSMLREYRMALRDTRMQNDNGLSLSIAKWNNMSRSIDCSNEENVALVFAEAKDLVVRFADYIQNNIRENGRINNRLARIMMYLDFEENETFNREKFIDSNFEKMNSLYEDYLVKLKVRSKKEMFEFIRQHYDNSIKIPTSSTIQLTEDKVAVLEKVSVGHLLGLQRAIYIDTPMSLGNEAMDNPLWDGLAELLEKQDNVSLSLPIRKMLIRIQHIIHGSVQIKEDDFESNLRYIRDDQLDIPLVEAATGIKSFAYIIRLLENGYLDKNTLFIVDEPEAHLHPQWIVEYARILVLLTKELGVRILIASHNPDMVAAIQSIGKKEGLDDAITFYQAQSSKEHPFEYEYKNLGLEITEIFKSFNIAISRIQDYGRTDNQ